MVIKAGEKNSAYELDIKLFGPIDPTRSRFNLKATKIELKLEKIEQLHWATLEAVESLYLYYYYIFLRHMLLV